MSVGRTALDILGLTALEGKVLPQFSSTGRSSVARVTGEHTDQSEPHSDQRRGGVPGSAVTITPDTEADHDGYQGRGSGKKDTDGTWDPSR